MDLFIASYKVHLFGKEIPGTVLLKQRLFQKNYLVNFLDLYLCFIKKKKTQIENQSNQYNIWPPT